MTHARDCDCSYCCWGDRAPRPETGSIHCPTHGNTELICALCEATVAAYTAEREAGFHAEITKLRAEIAALRARIDDDDRCDCEECAP